MPEEDVTFGKPMLEQAPVLMGGSHTGPDFLAGLVTPWGAHGRAECS